MSGSGKTHHCEVAVIGAGPYGLAVGAHLKAAKVDVRVFGEAMSFWRRNMPTGMKLRSPWHATHISDPSGVLTIDDYDSAGRMPRTDPVPLEEFVSYGEWFQRRAVPDLDGRKVTSVEAASRGFYLMLDDGNRVHARRVVVAMGLANQQFRPAEFSKLPTELVSHTCEHRSFQPFRRKRVAVIGRGQSACESAVLLKEAGAEVEIISRGEINWLGAPSKNKQKEPLWRLRDLLTPPSAVGPFPLNWVAEVPGIVHRFPADFRNWFNIRSLRAGAAGWLLPRFDGVRTNPGRTIVGAEAQGVQIRLRLDNASANYDHVLLATGYHVDISKLSILGAGLLRQVDCLDGSPRLSDGFESSIPGLHFVGSSAVRSFGPLMRFIAGSGYAARAVTRAVLAGLPRGQRGVVAKTKAHTTGKLSPSNPTAFQS